MPDFISSLASKTGLSTAKAEQGLGALLSSLQGNLSSDIFGKVTGAIPGATNMISGFESAAGKAAPSATSALTGLAGSLLGGQSGAAAGLLNNFAKVGFSADTVKSFLPLAVDMLSKNLSPDLMKAVEKGIPGLSSLVGGTDAGGLVSKIKKFF